MSRHNKARAKRQAHTAYEIDDDPELITLEDIEAMCRHDLDDPVPPHGYTPERWKIIRAKVLLRELWDIVRLDRRKRHPIALNVIADLACLATELVGAEGYWIAHWCRKFDPDLSFDEVALLVDRAESRHYTGDAIAHAFDVTFEDRERFALCQVGCCDDGDKSKRDAKKRAKAAARKRKSRAKHRSGRPRGRPGLDMSPEELKAHKRAQSAARKRKQRASPKMAMSR